MTTNSTCSDSEHSPKIVKHIDTDYIDRDSFFHTLTVGNYKIQFAFGEWHLHDVKSKVPYIESVRSDSRDTLLKIACRITNVEQEADLIRQMFLLAQGEANDRE